VCKYEIQFPDCIGRATHAKQLLLRKHFQTLLMCIEPYIQGCVKSQRRARVGVGGVVNVFAALEKPTF